MLVRSPPSTEARACGLAPPNFSASATARCDTGLPGSTSAEAWQVPRGWRPSARFEPAMSIVVVTASHTSTGDRSPCGVLAHPADNPYNDQQFTLDDARVSPLVPGGGIGMDAVNLSTDRIGQPRRLQRSVAAGPDPLPAPNREKRSVSKGVRSAMAFALCAPRAGTLIAEFPPRSWAPWGRRPRWFWRRMRGRPGSGSIRRQQQCGHGTRKASR